MNNKQAILNENMCTEWVKLLQELLQFQNSSNKILKTVDHSITIKIDLFKKIQIVQFCTGLSLFVTGKSYEMKIS